MNVRVYQLDGKQPNRACMRIAAHHRAQGDVVEFVFAPGAAAVERDLFGTPDLVYASLIFDWTAPLARRVLEVYPGARVGGSGWDLSAKLEDVGVATDGPLDYSLFPAFRASLGYTMRGCPLRCPFCVVPKSEGDPRSVATVADLWRGDRHARALLLLDNDFFGQEPEAWRARAREIRDGGFRVCFQQGLNARRLTDEQAETIASLDYRADDFRERRLYFAWDNAKEEASVFAGLDRVARAGVAPADVIVYMLVGFWPGEHVAREDRHIVPLDLHRLKRLREWGAQPYPMPYVRTPELVGFQRYALKGLDGSASWEEFTRAGYRPEKLGLRDEPMPLLGGGAS